MGVRCIWFSYVRRKIFLTVKDCYSLALIYEFLSLVYIYCMEKQEPCLCILCVFKTLQEAGQIVLSSDC